MRSVPKLPPRPPFSRRPAPLGLLAGALLGVSLVSASLVGTPPCARADEQEAPQVAADDAQQARRAQDKIAAGKIGRGLVATDPATRARALAQFLTRLRTDPQGAGDLEYFLDEMSRAIQVWANQHERLLEVWLHQAVHGTSTERERAVRLLAALGPEAIRRLAGELRHQRRHESQTTQPIPDDKPATAAHPLPTSSPQAGAPRQYDVGDLLAHGWTQFKLKSTLLREADAVSVREYDTGYIVTASQKGHEHLGMFLAAVRSTIRAVEERMAKAKTPPERTPQEERADRAAAREREVAQQDGGAQGPYRQSASGQRGTSGQSTSGQRGVPPGGVAQRVSRDRTRTRARPQTPLVPRNRAPVWQIVPMILHVPRGELLRARLAAELAAFGQDRPLLATSQILTGSLAETKHWCELARKMPNARIDVPLQGETLLAPGHDVGLFAGKEIAYTKDYQRTAAGGLRPQTETIRHGIELQVGVVREAGGLRVNLVSQRTDVGRPISVVTFRPSPGAAAVELERPQWSVTRRTDSFRLPHGGGSAFLPLPGIGTGPEDQVILVIRVRPYAK